MEKAKLIARDIIDIINYDQTLRDLEARKQQVFKSLKGEDDRLSEAVVYFEDEFSKLGEYKEVQLTIPEITGELDSAAPYYEEEDGIIIQKWDIIQNDNFQVQNKLNRLKAELAAKDYINLKRFQGQISDEQWAEFTFWAEQQRIEIRELEALITEV